MRQQWSRLPSCIELVGTDRELSGSSTFSMGCRVREVLENGLHTADGTRDGCVLKTTLASGFPGSRGTVGVGSGALQQNGTI